MAKATPSAKPYLEFKYVKNQMIGDLGDGVYYHIPTRMAAEPNPQAGNNEPAELINYRTGQRTPNPSAIVTRPQFDLEKVHKVELQNERPILPKENKNVGKEYHEKLCEQAYEAAAKAKLRNDEIRRRVQHYVDDGVIELVSDPFVDEDPEEGVAELAEILKATGAADTETTPKPRKIKE